MENIYECVHLHWFNLGLGMLLQIGALYDFLA